MGLAGVAVFGVCSLMVTFSLNAIMGWNLDAVCPGTASFCDGVYWKAVVEYLPTWLYVGQILVMLAIASPFAWISIRSR